MIRSTTLALAASVTLFPTCGDATVGPERPIVDTRTVLVPPPGYPVRDDAVVSQRGTGTSTLIRESDGATLEVTLRDQTPGHVLVLFTLAFNHPEYCVEGEDRLPEPGPCRGNGPLDPRDGGIPAVQVAADAWSSVVVGADGRATFTVDFGADTPIQNVNGAGLLAPLNAVVFSYVLDKGPLVAEGPLRGAQTGSMYGGCQGPPALGPLPCQGVAVAQHLPDA